MENALSKKERLEEICRVCFNGNKSAFGRALGQTPQTMNSCFSRGTLNACKIYECVPGLNPEWLLTGKGEMMIENNN